MIHREGRNWYWLYWAKTDPENDKNTIEFKWSDIQGEDQ